MEAGVGAENTPASGLWAWAPAADVGVSCRLGLALLPGSPTAGYCVQA
jgi:hypothetical protein